MHISQIFFIEAYVHPDGQYDTMNTTVYEEVAIWQVENCTTEDVNHDSWDDGVPATFYVCPSYGIIRKIVPGYSQDWQLISSDIVL